LKLFFNPANPDAVKKLHIIDVNKALLNKYEKYMLDNGKSYTTIGIYLRVMRTLYNKAIAENPAYEKHYPFGKGQYEIPATSKVKKALKKDDLKKLYKAIPQNELQGKAKDFWFFSYGCNGMNINDIALLKFKDLAMDENKLTFYRGKTQRTKKSNLKEISVLLTPFSKAIIRKYQNEETSPEDFVFDIISKSDSIAEQKRKIENFTRFINQHIKKLAKANEITEEISTYWARHSFSTMALNSGANIELISESLGHSDIKTTKSYLSGFDDANKEAIINKITDFL
jgi:integrase/recombinase XerD